MSSEKSWKGLAVLFAVAMFAVCATPSSAQKTETKEKPAMYTYVANWAIPRAQWGEMEKSNAEDAKLLDKDVADGTLVGYGADINLVHSEEAETHDDWWSSMSMAGLLKVLDQLTKSGGTTSPVLQSATKHWDGIYVSHYYNWRPGSVKGAYTRVQSYKLKADAPHDAVEMLSQNLIVPVFEKLIADGTIVEYEVDEQAVHTRDPNSFSIVYIAAHAEGLDKAQAAISESLKASPLSGPAFGSMVDFTAHRDELARTDATYK
jgi:DNA-binding protein YbaB